MGEMLFSPLQHNKSKWIGSASLKDLKVIGDKHELENGIVHTWDSWTFRHSSGQVHHVSKSKVL